MTCGALAEREFGHEEDIVNRYATLVKRIARHLHGRLPASVQLDDLEQAGLIGLMEAVRLYDPSQGAGFETYATIRVRGAMLDELRRNDWSPRSLNRRLRRLSEAARAIEHAEGRPAAPREVAERLGISVDEYHHWLNESSCQNFACIDAMAGFDTAAGDDDDSTYVNVEKLHCRDNLAHAISELCEREQMILSLYYEKEMTLKEIGEVLGVSESRVCQIHGEATTRLRRRMKRWQ